MSDILHKLPLRVYYEDTDAGGIVYHASYLKFAERGRTEMLRDAGFAHAVLLKETGVMFAVVSMQIDFKSPARLDDMLSVETTVVSVGGASMDLKQDILKDGQLMVGMTVRLACLDAAGRAVRLPQEVRKILSAA